MPRYSTVAHIWAFVFAFVGLSFTFVPTQTALLLTKLANAIGLSGDIVFVSNDLAHILALSLMATLTVLASTSGSYPLDNIPFIGILVAKFTSVFFFTWMTITVCPAWAVCAFGDLFVAVTLLLFRRNKGRYDN